MLAKVDVEGKHHFATMFTKVILAIIETEERTKLLQSPQMVFTVNNCNDVTHAVRKDSRKESERNTQDKGYYIVVEDDNQPKTWHEDPVVD